MGSGAGDEVDESKGAGAGQGHKPRSEVRLRSLQDAGRLEGRSGPGRAPPEKAPGPEPAASPPRRPPRSVPGASAGRGLGRLVLLPGAPYRQAAGVRRGRRVAEAAPSLPGPRPESLPAVTFRGCGATRRPGPRPALTCGVRSGSWQGRAPHSKLRARAPGSPAPRGPSTAPRSEAAAAAMSALFSAAAAPVGPCGATGAQTSREPGRAGAGRGLSVR